MIIPRGTSKTGLSLIHLLENLKKKAKSEEEKQYYEQIQNEYAKFHQELILGYWR